MVSLRPRTRPVIAWTILSLLPGVACARAIELDRPLAQTTKPAYADATSQPKSMRMRRAIVRASNPETTKPNPQFSQHATADVRNVSVTAPLGVAGIAANASRARVTGRLA